MIQGGASRNNYRARPGKRLLGPTFCWMGGERDERFLPLGIWARQRYAQ